MKHKIASTESCSSLLSADTGTLENFCFKSVITYKRRLMRFFVT